MSGRNNSSYTCKSNGTGGLVVITIERFGEAICLVYFTTSLSSTTLFPLLLGGIPLCLLLILGVLLLRERIITSKNT